MQKYQPLKKNFLIGYKRWGGSFFSNSEHIDLKQKLHFLKQVEGMAELKELRLKVIFIENENFYRKGNHCKLQLKTENLYNLKVQNYNWN